jgi:hypothetical protein
MGLFGAALEPDVPFAVPCPCGHVLHGKRRGKPQVLPCPACGRDVFIFPHRRFPPPSSQPDPLGQALPAPPVRRLLLLALGSAVVLILLVVLVLRLWWHHPNQPGAQAPNPSRPIQTALEVGKRALAEGSFHLACDELTKAVRLAGESPDTLPLDERRELNQLQRQSALLASLLPQTIEGLLRQAEDASNDKAWQARFKHQYRGKGLILDDVIRRLPDRSVVLRSAGVVRVDGVMARLVVSDLLLLEGLPLDTPQRWLIGARIAGFAREGGPEWIVHLEHDSGVLLRRQAACLQTLPMPRPVLP